MSFRTILGLKFYTGDMSGLLRLTREGGLIVVPSAPVLVQMPRDSAHRAALEGSDFALTDSGFMVLLWRFLHRERLPRISGLKYLRALVENSDFQQPEATFWVMPTASQATGDRAWLRRKGLDVSETDCYIAPVYSPGPLSDPALLALLEERRPRYIILCLGGGVQERLGFYLRKNLSAFAEPEAGGRRTDGPTSDLSPPASGIRPLAFGLPPPAILCTGAAIAFLSEQQANIPVWADRYMLGWLLRTLHDPRRFIPRYWKALRLVPLLFRYGAKPVGESSRRAGPM